MHNLFFNLIKFIREIAIITIISSSVFIDLFLLTCLANYISSYGEQNIFSWLIMIFLGWPILGLVVICVIVFLVLSLISFFIQLFYLKNNCKFLDIFLNKVIFEIDFFHPKTLFRKFIFMLQLILIFVFFIIVIQAVF